MKVTAYQAKDGTLFKTEAEQAKHDNSVVVGSLVTILANFLMNSAPDVSDFGIQCYTNSADMEISLESMLQVHKDTLKKLVKLL